MRILSPEKFLEEDLGKFVGLVSRAEFDTLLTQQAQAEVGARKPRPPWSPRQGIVTALSYGARVGGLKLDEEDKTAVLQIMESEAYTLHQAKGGKPLTEQDYADLFKSATRSVKTKTSVMGLSTGESRKPRYELDGSAMPNSVRKKITAQYRSMMGREPTEADVLRLYRIQTR